MIDNELKKYPTNNTFIYRIQIFQLIQSLNKIYIKKPREKSKIEYN